MIIKLISHFSVLSKRIFFFLAVNFLIVMTLLFVANVVTAYFEIKIEGLGVMLVFYSFLGMGASFISLWMSKTLAINFMGVKIISKKGSDYKNLGDYKHLVQKVHYFSNKAGLPVKPDVGIYESAEVNAFATGPSRKNSLVAVSTGLLNSMNDQEVEGVLAHEVAHIANGDMVTMSLIQGLVNVMVYLIAHILTQALINTVFRGRSSWFMNYIMHSVIASLLFIPGSMLTCFFSRYREYRADKGGALFAGRDKMISALQALSQINQAPSLKKPAYKYLMISGSQAPSLLTKLFSTHPPIQDRIKRLSRPLSYR